MPTAVMVPSFLTPMRMRTRIGWRVRPVRKFSSRVKRQKAQRPVRSATMATTSSSSTSCFEPKPPPMRGLMTRTFCTGIPSVCATMRREWKGTCVEVVMTMRPAPSSLAIAV